MKLNNQNISVESEVTYVSEQFNSSGNNDALIKYRVKTGRSSFAEILDTCELFMSYESKLLLSSLLNRIIVNCQTWTKLRNKDYQDLNVCVQAGIKRIIKSPTSTPNCAVCLELGLTPVEYEIKRRKLGFLHKILNSDKNGIIARIYNDQKTSFEKSGEINWYSEVDDLKKEFEINLILRYLNSKKIDGKQ